MTKCGAGDTLEITAGESSLTIDLAVGHVRSLSLRHDGRDVRPLFRAPWLDEDPASLPADLPAVNRRLGCDFLCAPFGANDLAGHEGPQHGLTANTRWDIVDVDSKPDRTMARLELGQTVMGARVTKEITLCAGAPLLFQRHVFTGGDGLLTVSHHVNVHMSGGGTVRHSPIDHAWTCGAPQDPGFNKLAYPGRSGDLATFPGVDGDKVDLGSYPLAETNEDFFTLVDKRGVKVAWTAVQRAKERDMVMTLKDPGRLPVTMLWMSNGGRTHSPWNSRTRGVLGVEDGICYDLSHAAAVQDNHMSAAGFPTCATLRPDGSYETRHLLAAASLPEGWGTVENVTLSGDAVAISDDIGNTMGLPVPTGFPSL